VTTAQFVALAERISGRDLSALFTAWLSAWPSRKLDPYRRVSGDEGQRGARVGVFLVVTWLFGALSDR